jgi:prolipoprotein diacylglyceryltransferase
MQFINDFLRSQPDGGLANYGLMGTIGQGVMMLAVLFYFIRMKSRWLDWIKGAFIGFLAFEFCVYAQHFFTWYHTGFALDSYEQVSNIAVAFTALPLVAWLCAKTFNTSVGFAGDISALALLGFHFIGRSGCMFTGCCYGFPCDWGVYSHRTGANQFPVWWVESLFTLAILIFILVRICRKGYVPDGKNLPYFLFFYGVCRFFSEFTRESTRDHWIFWRFSDVHVHMLLMAAVGGLMLWYIHKKERVAAVGEEPALPTLKSKRK